MKHACLALGLAAAVVGVTNDVHAGGYDTPILYSARHMGMAGTAVSYVNDPSALFHNPAGLGRVERASVIGNASPLLGGIKASPGPQEGATDIDSETTFAPFFLVGGAFRITDFMVAGVGVYPVASAGGEFKYTINKGMDSEQDVVNRTTLFFLEASPGLAFNLPGNVTLGAGYRITYVSLERLQESTRVSTGDQTAFHDFEMSGLNFLGFRVGAQWHGEFGGHALKLGAHYRHKTITKIDNDEGTAAFAEFTDINTKFILPSRISAGARYDVQDFGVALDVEYGFNGQNKGYPLKGTTSTGSKASVANLFNWDDSWTVRGGLEYRLVDDHVPVRVGYIWDQQTSNPTYPSAFGTPPGPSHVATCGTGWNGGPWQVNLALAYRMAEGEVNTPDPACVFCGAQGDEAYQLWMLGTYLDFSYAWN
jgi:long-subunit fatty acid transport protein